MNHLLKVTAVFLVLIQFNNVLSKKYMRIIRIEKDLEHEHEILLHHFKPISFIKETITPFGKFSFRHSIEKRDSHTRKAREIEDLIKVPDVDTEELLKPIIDTKEIKLGYASVPTDIILTRMEFYKGQPIESMKLHSILTPGFSEHEQKEEEHVEPPLTEIESDSEKESESEIKETVHEPIPLSAPEQSEPLNNGNEPIAEEKSDTNVVDVKADAEEISEATEVKSDLKDLELNEEHHEKEEAHPELPEPTVEKETPESNPILEPSESGAIDNKDETHAVDEHLEIISPIKEEELDDSKTIVEVTIKPAEITPLPVSPLPEPVYIPLYTDVKTPAPVPAVVNIPAEPSSEVHEVVSVVVTEREGGVPPPGPPPVQTVETVIETERPGLFSRGSRFMLNISSKILKKLLRFVSSARSKLHIPPPVDE